MTPAYPRLPSPEDGANLTQYLIRFCEEVKDQFCGEVTSGDVEPRLREHLQARIVECNVRGMWQWNGYDYEPIASRDAPFIRVECRLMPHGSVVVGCPLTVITTRESAFTVWRHPAWPIGSPIPSTSPDARIRATLVTFPGSVTELARSLGVSRATLYAWSNGERVATEDDAERLVALARRLTRDALARLEAL